LLLRTAAVAGYSAPFPSARFRAGVAKWPLLVPLSRSYPFVEQPWRDLDSARDFLKTWTRPALVMFSDKCFVTRGLDSYFLKLIPYCRENPDGCHITIRGAGHFLQVNLLPSTSAH
jgi:haloalkane dehalogenase